MGLNGFTVAPLVGDLLPVPPALRDELLTTLLSGGVLKTDRNNRCPGSLERGAIFRPTPDFNCDPTQVPIGR